MSTISAVFACRSPFVLASILVLATGVFGQGVHRDERLGFQVRPPRGWEEVPLRVDETWIVGKFRSPKEDFVVDPKTGYTRTHTPEMRILAFLSADAPDPDEEDEERSSGRAKVYRDYKEYMRENYRQGFFVEEEEVDKHGDLAVTRLLIKAEGERYVLEKKVVTWVYETELGNIAVQVEVAGDSYKKMRSAVEDVMRSFRTIERTKDVAVPAEAPEMPMVDLSALSPAERKQHKIEAHQRLWEKMTADLPKDWTAKEIGGVYVINHTDDRFAKKVVEQVNAVRAWLDQTFPDVGPDDYACPPIVRICKDQAEETAFRGGSGTYGVSGNRLVTHKGTRSETWEWEYISEQTMSCWFLERDFRVWLALPAWLRRGLYEVVGASSAKGSKLSFDLGWLEQYKRNYRPGGDEDDGLSIRSLMSLTTKEFYESDNNLANTTQAAALTRFFVEARSRKTRPVLSDYMGHLRQALTEAESEKPTADEEAGEPGTEAEEDALFKARQEWFKSRERLLLDQTFQRTFQGWTPAEWRNLKREFERSL